MRLALLKTFLLLALVALGGAALADPPARVGRVALVQGQASVRAGDADEGNPALPNWPLTSGNRLATAPGALLEWRVGSAAVRLAGDSELEIVQLDDDNFRLRLNYGSVSVRIRHPDLLRGFELSTAQARVQLTQPGRVRVDAELVPDTSAVNVLDGTAQVDGGATRLTLSAGRRAEISDDGVRTGALLRDRFDDWPEAADARPATLEYLSDETTGYEVLDEYGSWQQNAEYGPLWLPAALPADWAPYRDGRWIWLAPWGWTWVDNAPWGYAPSHYGRWVQLGGRWGWTPGRPAGRPVWAPALVGWVGDGQWQATFASGGARRTAPAVGWFPLTPRDAFVPGYRSSAEYQRRINAFHAGARAQRDERHEGLTVLPHEQFGARGTVVVTNAPRALLAPADMRQAPLAAAPPLRMIGPEARGRPLPVEQRRAPPQVLTGVPAARQPLQQPDALQARRQAEAAQRQGEAARGQAEALQRQGEAAQRQAEAVQRQRQAETVQLQQRQAETVQLQQRQAEAAQRQRQAETVQLQQRQAEAAQRQRQPEAVPLRRQPEAAKLPLDATHPPAPREPRNDGRRAGPEGPREAIP